MAESPADSRASANARRSKNPRSKWVSLVRCFPDLCGGFVRLRFTAPTGFLRTVAARAFTGAGGFVFACHGATATTPASHSLYGLRRRLGCRGSRQHKPCLMVQIRNGECKIIFRPVSHTGNPPQAPRSARTRRGASLPYHDSNRRIVPKLSGLDGAFRFVITGKQNSDAIA